MSEEVSGREPTQHEYAVVEDVKAGEFLVIDPVTGGLVRREKSSSPIFAKRTVIEQGMCYDAIRVPTPR